MGPRKKSSKSDYAEIVLDALRRAHRPMGAYDVISMVRRRVALAPPTVYRALDRLIEAGQAHKVESLNAFVACRHDDHHEDAAFAICDTCGNVTEFSLPKLGALFKKWSRSEKFVLNLSVVELHGTCTACHGANGHRS